MFGANSTCLSTLSIMSNSLWYGPKAIPEFAQVFGCPFSDPTDHYRHSIEAVECKARQLGVELTIRKSEPNFIAGQAASSKAERVRRQYKALCRRASQSTSPTNSSLIQSGGDPHMSRLGSFPMTSTQQLEDPEVLVDVEKTAVTPIEENVRPGFRHESSLAYRVWDDSRYVQLFHRPIIWLTSTTAARHSRQHVDSSPTDTSSGTGPFFRHPIQA